MRSGSCWAIRPSFAGGTSRALAEGAPPTTRSTAPLGAWCAARAAGEAEALLLAAGVPAAQCINPHFLSPNPQLEARGFFTELEHPVMGRLRHPELPIGFASPARPLLHTPAPTLGQHNEELLRELGLSGAEIASLRERGIIGTRPTGF